MYSISSPYYMTTNVRVAIINDKPQKIGRTPSLLDHQLNDYYHLFLAKIARLPQEEALTEAEEARLIALFGKINQLKRELEVG